jgi:hypothetical protein
VIQPQRSLLDLLDDKHCRPKDEAMIDFVEWFWHLAHNPVPIVQFSKRSLGVFRVSVISIRDVATLCMDMYVLL